MLAVEGMILLSRIIKSFRTKEQPENEVSIKIRPFPTIELNEEEQELEIDDALIHQQMEQAKTEANAIVSEARNQAQAILDEIQQARNQWEFEEKPMYIEQAQKEGYQQGKEDGIQQGYSEMAEILAHAKEIVALSKQDYEKRIEAAEPVILELAIKAAEKIIGLKLDETTDAFLSIVKRTIKQARDHREVQLHVHPTRYAFILSQKEELDAIFPKNTDFYIYPDEDLSENSCIIESENGRIDASVDSQLHELRTKLMEFMEGE